VGLPQSTIATNPRSFFSFFFRFLPFIFFSFILFFFSFFFLFFYLFFFFLFFLFFFMEESDLIDTEIRAPARASKNSARRGSPDP